MNDALLSHVVQVQIGSSGVVSLAGEVSVPFPPVSPVLPVPPVAACKRNTCPRSLHSCTTLALTLVMPIVDARGLANDAGCHEGTCSELQACCSDPSYRDHGSILDWVGCVFV